MARRLALVLACGLLFATPAAGDNSGKIASLQSKIAAARAREAHLSADVASITQQIRTLESRVGDVSQRLSVLEQDLELHQRRLEKLNALYALQTERLHFLHNEYERVVGTLSSRMVDLYETQDPSLIEVILDSKSLQEALDHLHYLDAIAAQDKQITHEVRTAKDQLKIVRARTKVTRAAVASATRAVAVRTEQQRQVRDELIATKGRLGKARSSKRTSLAATRAQERDWVAEADALASAASSPPPSRRARRRRAASSGP
jgi:peptidoglycan hydrolase CwlO-like protein